VDTPSKAELIGATHSVDEIRDFLEADSLGYLSMEGLLKSVGTGSQHYCTSCYTGVYPVVFPQNERSYLQLALKLDKVEREPVSS
jgi:amidophosphoribosyltransferase